MSPSIPIDPDTRIADLLEAYPALEEVLIQKAAVFQKLRNPILRRTVARVATIESAARIAGISPRDLVRTLREAAGQPPEDAAEGAMGGETRHSGETSEDSEPDWVRSRVVRETIDADAILAAGEAPLPGVLRHLKALDPEGCIRIVSSFPPAPLVDAVRHKGYKIYTHRIGANRFETRIAG